MNRRRRRILIVICFALLIGYCFVSAWILTDSWRKIEIWTDVNITAALHRLDLVDPKNVKAGNEFVFDNLVFVSGWTSNHHDEARYLCRSLRFYPELRDRHWRLIVFHLGGVSQRQQRAYRSCCPQAEFREFPFWLYPAFVGEILSYRFKPLAIAEALLEEKAVLWVDTSIQFLDNKKSLTDIFNLVAQSSEMLKMTLFGLARHSIFVATNPLMYKYFPLAINESQRLEMYEASHMLWLGTLEVKRDLLRPLVECALIEDCMAPPGANIECLHKIDLTYTVYGGGGCHRYDQSAINLIAAIATGAQEMRYRIADSPMKTKRQARV